MKKILCAFLSVTLVILSTVCCISANAYNTAVCCNADHTCCCCCEHDCNHYCSHDHNDNTLTEPYSYTAYSPSGDTDIKAGEYEPSEDASYTDFIHFHALKGHNITLYLSIKQCPDISGIWCEIRHNPAKLQFTGYDQYYPDTVNTTVNAGFNIFSILFSPNGTNITDEKTIISFSYTLIEDIEQEDAVLSYTLRELIDSHLHDINYQCFGYRVDNNSINIYDTESDTPHIHSPVVHPAVEETCTTEGYSEWVDCSTCGEVLTPRLIIPPRGHDDVLILPVDPTCTTPGKTEEVVCSVCGFVLKPAEEIPALGHLPVTDPAREATCQQTGLTEGSHCSRCNEILKAQEVLPTVPHKFVDGYCIYCGLAEFDTPNPIGVYGDINNDGNITARDALLLLRYTIKLYSFTTVQESVADVNGDNKVNTSDALLIQRHSIGINTKSKIGDYCD